MEDSPDCRLRRLLDRWDDVEGSIKRAELFQGQVTIPAVNELRYAGRQVIKAVSVREAARSNNTSENPQISTDTEYLRALTNAEQYVMNADHDVVDGVIVFISKRVSELNFRFGRDAIAKHLPCYVDFCNRVEYCKSEVERSRRVKSKERSEIYATMKAQDMPALIDSYNVVISGETVMAAFIDAKESELNAISVLARRRLLVILVLFGVIFLLACILLLI